MRQERDRPQNSSLALKAGCRAQKNAGKRILAQFKGFHSRSVPVLLSNFLNSFESV